MTLLIDLAAEDLPQQIDDGLDWLRDILAGLSPEQIGQLIQQAELLDQGCFVTKALQRKVATGRMTVEDYARAVGRQHNLLAMNKTKAVR